MDMFVSFITVIRSQVYTYVKTVQIVQLKYSLLYITYTSLSCKKKF